MVILDKEVFQHWLANPATQDFLALLKRRRSDLMEEWARGMAPLVPELQAQAVLLGRLAEVSFDDVRDFAGLGPLESGDEEGNDNEG